MPIVPLWRGIKGEVNIKNPFSEELKCFLKKSKLNFMSTEKNETNIEAQQTQKGCMRVTLFFVVFTAVAIAVMFLIKKFMA
jgi:hypothetical protein